MSTTMIPIMTTTTTKATTMTMKILIKNIVAFTSGNRAKLVEQISRFLIKKFHCFVQS